MKTRRQRRWTAGPEEQQPPTGYKTHRFECHLNTRRADEDDGVLSAAEALQSTDPAYIKSSLMETYTECQCLGEILPYSSRAYQAC